MTRKVLDKQGNWEYVVYLPNWCDPEWDDEFEVDRTPGKPPVRTKRAFGDVFQQIRPAVLARDAMMNPTELAKRWGIHPDHKADGRSQLSPRDALSRRVQLSRPMVIPGPDGSVATKDFLDAGDLATARGRYVQAGLAAQGRSFVDFLKAVAQSPDGGDDQAEQASALLALLNMLDNDEFYQRMLFYDFSTDEVYVPLSLPRPSSRR